MGSRATLKATLRTLVCALALAGVFGSAARFMIYDIMLTEQFMRVGVGASR